MIKNLVSIIIPAYNHASALERCLEHVFAQTYAHIEVIVVDDGSTDATPAILQKFADRAKIFRQENAGSNIARNRGWREAQGEFLLFCDADVMMRADMVEKMVRVLEHDPHASFAYSQFLFGWKLFRGTPWDPEIVRQKNIAHSTSLIRAQDFFGFDEHIRRFQDWDVWLTFLGKGKYGIFISEVLFAVEIHGASRIGSAWLPRVAYAIPWEKIGWVPERIVKYRAAREIILKKHHLPVWTSRSL